MKPLCLLLVGLLVSVGPMTASPDEPKKGEIAILATAYDTGVIVPGKGVRSTTIRSEDELLAGVGIPADKRDKGTNDKVLGEWAKALNVEKIDFQKQMIVSIAFEHSPSPRTSPEVFQVVASDDKKQLAVHWRWVSPEIDTDQVGQGRTISILVPRSDAVVMLKNGPGRVRKK